MPLLFLSYASANSKDADEVERWLHDNGWTDLFRDSDPKQGVQPGEEWRKALAKALEAADAGIMFVSPEWLRSEWCQYELATLCKSGKLVFPLLIADTKLHGPAADLIERLQRVDISAGQSRSKGLARLGEGLKRAGLEPRSFDLPKGRPPYPGLVAFEEEDAAVFFGRDEEIKEGLKLLRQIHDGASNRALCILGASGAGKSSFLRAGLLARIRRDTLRFAILPLIRPEQAAVTGFRGLQQSLGVGELADDAAVLEALRSHRKKAASTLEDGDAASLTLIAAIDQAEELFSSENKAEGQDFLKHIARIAKLDPRFVAVFTIRSDTYEPLQTAPAFAELKPQPLDLPPISSPTILDSIIEGPGKLVRPKIVFRENLKKRLVDDLAGQDALPLLALALRRLVDLRRRDTEELTLDHYSRIGGLKGIIEDVAERALTAALNDAGRSADRSLIETLAKRTFIPALVRIDSKESAPLRRAAHLVELPAEARNLVNHFVTERLLVSDGDRIEVAHEAILRQWSMLRSWIEAERGDLILAENVVKSATDWRNALEDQRKDFLFHRGSLHKQAVELRRRDAVWAARIAPADDYLAACKERDDDERNDLLNRDRRNLIQTQRLLAGNADGLRREYRADGAMRVALLGELDADAVEKGVAADGLRYARLAQAAHEAHLEVKAEPHPQAIPCIAFSPDGTRVATGAQDAIARLIDVETGAIVRSFVGHRRESSSPKQEGTSEKAQTWINGIGFDATGDLIATGSSDSTVRIWEVASGRELHKVQAPNEVRCLSVAKSANLIAGGCTGGQVGLWTFDGRRISIVDTGSSTVLGVALSADGATLAVGKENGSVQLHDVPTGALRWEKPHGSMAVSSVAYAPAGDLVVSASHDLSAIVWDVNTGDKRTPVRGHTEAIRSVTFNGTGKRFATAGGDGMVRVWDVDSGRQVLTLGGHDGWVQCVAFAPDARRLASGGFDGTARIWDTRESFSIRRFRGLQGFVSALAIHPNGRTFAVGGHDAVRIVSSETGRVTCDVSAILPSASHLEFGADGSILFATDKAGRAVVANPNSGALIGETAIASGSVSGALVPGMRSAILGNEHHLLEWAWETKKSPTKLASIPGRIALVAVSPDASRIACADVNGTIQVLDRFGRILKTFDRELGPIQCLRFDPTGRVLVAGARDRPFLLRVWNTDSWQYLDFPDHTDAIWGLSFSPDGRRLATACRDRHVRIFRTDEDAGVVTGDYVFDEQAQSVALAPDGRFVVTGGRHGQLQILDSVFPAALSDAALVQTVARHRLRGAARKFTISERSLVGQLSLGLNLETLDLSDAIVKLSEGSPKDERDKHLAACDEAYRIWREHREASFGPDIVLPPSTQPPKATRSGSGAADRTLQLVLAAASAAVAGTVAWLFLSGLW